jgi:hypothetical protein
MGAHMPHGQIEGTRHMYILDTLTIWIPMEIPFAAVWAPCQNAKSPLESPLAITAICHFPAIMAANVPGRTTGRAQ